MAEVLGIISSVIALCQAIDGLGKGMRLVATINGAPDAFVDLQNELVTVLGYLHQLRELLAGLPTPSSGAPAPRLDHLQSVADGLNDEVQKLNKLALDFQADSQGRTDANGRPKVPKIKWARHLHTINELRERVSRRKHHLSHAVSLLQTKETAYQGALMVDFIKVTNTRFDTTDDATQRAEAAISTLKSEFTQTAGAVISNLRENEVQGNTLLGRTDELKEIVSKVESMVASGTEGQPTPSEVMSELQALRTTIDDFAHKLDRRDSNHYREIASMQATLHEIVDRLRNDDHSTGGLERDLGALVLTSESGAMSARQAQLGRDYRGSRAQSKGSLMSVQTVLSTGRRCRMTCKCQCHRASVLRSPGVLSGILGKLLVAYNSIPFWTVRTCDHPKCQRNSPDRVQLNYLFPRWMLQRGLAVSLSWSSVTGSGADLHLAIPRVISDSNFAWVAVAIADHNIPWLQSRLEKKELWPTDVDDYGESLLMYALCINRYNCSSFLWSQYPKSSLSWQSSSGRSAGSLILHRVLLYGEQSLESPALREIYALTSDDHMSTTVIDATLGIGNISLEAALDDDPKSINLHDSTGYTALHWAARRNDIDAVCLLLSYGADCSVRTADAECETAVHIAAWYGSTSIVKELLATGINVETRNSKRRTPLFTAVNSGRSEMVEAFLSAGASAQAVDTHGWTAFHWATAQYHDYQDSEEDMFAIFSALVKHGGDADGRISGGDAAIHLAVARDNGPVFRALCRLGAKVDEVGGWGWTILHYAASYGRLEILSTMLELDTYTLDPDLVNTNGDTATDLFEYRQWKDELNPLQARSTNEEQAVFEQLIFRMRERFQSNFDTQSGADESDSNWESCEE